MACYFIAQINIHDLDEYQKYLDGFDDIFKRYNGKVIAVDDKPSVLEGEWSYSRIVMIRFPDENEAKRWYESPEYQKLAQYRRGASTADALFVNARE